MPFGLGWPELTILLVISAVAAGLLALASRASKSSRFPSSFPIERSDGANAAATLRYNPEEQKEAMMADESWSQGRLAPESLSAGTGAHYIHEYLRVATIAEHKGGLGMGAAQEKASPYSVEKVEAHLNRRAEQGWLLVSMQPHWWHERQVISGAMSIARPLAIVGWYLTFERGE